MHIETELDDVYAERLLQLQHRLQKPLVQVITTAIDITLAQLDSEKNDEPSPLYQAFEEAGLIGCIIRSLDAGRQDKIQGFPGFRYAPSRLHSCHPTIKIT